MAKALLGQRYVRDDRLMREAARLRTRVRDLEALIGSLKLDNDRLRADLAARTAVGEREPAAAVALAAPLA